MRVCSRSAARGAHEQQAGRQQRAPTESVRGGEESAARGGTMAVLRAAVSAASVCQLSCRGRSSAVVARAYSGGGALTE